MHPCTSELFAKAFYENEELPLSYRPGMTSDERSAWKVALKSKILSLMAFSENAYETPLVNHLLRKDRGSYYIDKYEISPEPSLWARFLVLTPKSASAEHKAPAVLCTPGTGWTKEALAGEDFHDLTYHPAQPPIGLAHR